MLNKFKETELLEYALEALRQHVETFGQVDIEQAKQQPGEHVEADIVMHMRIQGKDIRFYINIKRNITRETLRFIQLQHAQQNPRYPILLIIQHATPQMAEELKKANMPFVDTAGNAYINQPPLLIYIKGNKPPGKYEIVPIKRAFRTAGLKLIYALLIDKELINRTYREIADRAGVALGTVNIIMNELKQLNFILDMGKKGKRLTARDLLYHKWETAYHEQLRPKLILGKYAGLPGWWEQKKLDPEIAQWGGEIAAARLTQYLKPQDVTLYIDPAHLNQILLDNRLRKDPHGETEILERFWKPAAEGGKKDAVHPLLVHADLLATGNERNIETAKMIYEQYIIRLIRED